jgi:hypothetical protein
MARPRSYERHEFYPKIRELGTTIFSAGPLVGVRSMRPGQSPVLLPSWFLPISNARLTQRRARRGQSMESALSKLRHSCLGNCLCFPQSVVLECSDQARHTMMRNYKSARPLSPSKALCHASIDATSANARLRFLKFCDTNILLANPALKRGKVLRLPGLKFAGDGCGQQRNVEGSSYTQACEARASMAQGFSCVAHVTDERCRKLGGI